MGSSKKHKKNKSERREKYEEYSQHQDPAQLQRGLKLILKVGSNATPEYSANSPLTALDGHGPPTAAEAMMAAAPDSPTVPEELQCGGGGGELGHRERHKKSKKKKKKKDREKKHKHHKEKRHRSRDRHRELCSEDRHLDETPSAADDAACSGFSSTQQRSPRSQAPASASVDADCSQDGFSFMDDDADQSQPLPENILYYAGITTDNSPSNCPVTKPIAPRKLDDMLLGSPTSSSLGMTSSGSPTKPLPDLLIPSPSGSTAASTSGGASSLNALTPKALEAPKTPSSSSESGREPRSCVLKLKQQKSPLNKLLEHLLRFLEKRDPHQFFAWPVTDDIAPGYSSIISKPMDFSTMRQKIDDHEYAALSDFSDDFRLMCENAIRYNHVDTVYHKAAKRLLQLGLKQLQPENLMRTLKPLSGYIRELTAKELGFELSSNELAGYDAHDSADEGASTGAEEPPTPAQLEEEERKRALRLENAPKTHFEPYVDDLTSEEILAQVQGAAQQAKQRISAKQRAHKMGFLRQRKDGTTTLNLLMRDENEGPEKVVTIGDLVGKLPAGSAQLHGIHTDQRNAVKPVKPLGYGPFASFAPTFDSRFSTLSAEETKLVLRTYGDASSAEYAESILQFTKDSSYGTNIANGLLDILTNGEHSKSLDELYNMQLHNYEQREIEKCFNRKQELEQQPETSAQIEQEYEKYKNTRMDFKRLRSLKDLGIDVDFLDGMETDMKNFELSRRMHEHLNNNMTLIEKLRLLQQERLSQPLPAHLALVPPAGQEESQTAQQLTQQLSDLAKKLPPSAIADQYALRKAMGMSFAGLPPPPTASPRVQLPELLQQPVALPLLQPVAVGHVPMDIDEPDVHAGGDLENELREFLESGSGMHTSSNPADDNNIVAQLLLN
ncbi:bromodomain-containing protein 7 [Drosophila montana]|uniref:bromodomain-containing protein 7 n=1 Tax=Drosophila montana TaxID=40370 RepID=UPI00313E8524